MIEAEEDEDLGQGKIGTGNVCLFSIPYIFFWSEFYKSLFFYNVFH
jgi:hypothetical protein